MNTPYETSENWDSLRKKIMGLGETSARKTYYPELQQRLEELYRFKALLDLSTEAMFLAHFPSGKLVDANGAACQQLGYEREDLLAMPLERLIDAHAARHVRGLINNNGCCTGHKPGQADQIHVYNGGFAIQTILQRCDDSRLPVELNVRLVALNGSSYAVIGARDVSEREQAEKARRESDERFRMMAEGVSDGITIVEQGKVVYLNERACEIFGYPYEELSQMNIIDLAAPDEVERVRRLKEDSRRSGKLLKEIEFWIQRKDGSRCCVHNRYSPVHREGQLAGYYVISSDVTERAQRERELEAIAAVATALRMAHTRTDMLPVILEQLIDLLKAEGAALSFGAPDANEIVVELAHGVWSSRTGARLRNEAGVIPQEIVDGRPCLCNALESGESHPFLSNGVQHLICLPLIAHGQSAGILWIGAKTPFNEGDIRTLTAITDVAASALHRADLHEQTQQRVRRLAALRSIDMTITASLDLQVTLDILLHQVTAHLNVDAAAVLLFKPHTQTLEFAAGHGFRSPTISRTRLFLREDLAGQAAFERRILHAADINNLDERSPRMEALGEEGFVTAYCAPLISKGEVEGVLEIFHRAPLHPDGEWIDFLEALGMQAAIAIENASLVDGLQRSNMELTMAYDNTLEGWVRTLDLRDKETQGHTQRVTNLTLRLAMAMGIHDSNLVHVRRGALLHDIGKLAIPDSLLHKAGALTTKEWELMCQHPVYAYELLAPIPYLLPALDIPYCHHERWDGAGYPRGLQGEQIPLPARVFAIVDVWDALRSDRPYREAWPEEKVRAYLREQSRRHFDPRVVDKFLKLLEEEDA